MMHRLTTALLCGSAIAGTGATLPPTTVAARKLVLARINAIAQEPECRLRFAGQRIDLDLLRATVSKARFYNLLGNDGDLKFSQVVGRPALPDEKLRDLAAGLPADAFVLGFYEGDKYVRTRHVILNRGYFEQEQDGIRRPTTEQEKQALLLHEILHIALDKDDDALTERELCPLRLLAFCPANSNPRTSRSRATGPGCQAGLAAARVRGGADFKV
jgi:hypothetical protein